MRDEETGSWWQQITGEAIQGPLQGQRLRAVPHDELTFALWKNEQPGGRVLRPVAALQQAGQYPSDWENEVGKMPVRITARLDGALEPRALVAGVSRNGQAKAYPLAALQQQSPIMDTLGGKPMLLLVGDDKKSVRAFDRTLDGRVLEFYRKPDAVPLQLIDDATGSLWDFTGRATDGPLKGRTLEKISILHDYWFDWKTYHPQTLIYQLH